MDNYVKSELYAHVYHVNSCRTPKKWVAKVAGHSKYAETEREAAKEADKILIRMGKVPVNILKPSSPTLQYQANGL